MATSLADDKTIREPSGPSSVEFLAGHSPSLRRVPLLPSAEGGAQAREGRPSGRRPALRPAGPAIEKQCPGATGIPAIPLGGTSTVRESFDAVVGKGLQSNAPPNLVAAGSERHELGAEAVLLSGRGARVNEAVDTDRLFQAQKEINHLKDTISALRAELDRAAIDKEESVDRAVSHAVGEAAQLHNTVGALRDRLEALRLDKDEAVQRARAANQAEITQLMDTVSALREELERLRLEKDQSVQKAVAAADGEIRQLKATAAGLRHELERLRVEMDDAVERSVARANAELTQLKATTAALRDQLVMRQSEYEERVESERRGHSEERLHLQKTIEALRERLETLHGDK